MGRIDLPPTYEEARDLLEEAIGNSVRSRRKVTAAYTILPLDEVIGVDTSGGDPITVSLPAVNSNWDGKVYWVHDIGGTAATDNITIDTVGAPDINGADTYVMNVDYEAVTIITDGTNWFVLGNHLF